MNKDIKQNKFYPYFTIILIVIYITVQFLTMVSTNNIDVRLEEMSKKQKSVIEFLISKNIESATNTSKYKNIVNLLQTQKEMVMRFISFNKAITVYDILVFDLNGNLLNESCEKIKSFDEVFPNIKINSIIDTIIVDTRFSETFDERVIDILVPVFEDGQLKAVMWEVQSFEKINSAIKTTSILDNAQSYIINEKGEILTDVKDQNNIKEKILVKDDVKKNSKEGFFSNSYIDYNGKKVYGYHSKLSINDWKLITEIEESQVKGLVKDINTFVIRSVSLFLAGLKLLDPVIKNQKTKKNKVLNDKCYKIELIKPKNPKKQSKFTFNICVSKLNKFIEFYQKNSDKIRIVFLVLISSLIIYTISVTKINNDISFNLYTSNSVNKKIMEYYINQVESTFSAMIKVINEVKELETSYYMNAIYQNNKEILNITVLDENQKIIYSTQDHKLSDETIKNILSNNNSSNSVEISKIYYDKDFDKYVFYMNSKFLDHSTNSYKDVICVVSFDKLVDILKQSEIYQTRTISVLSGKEIMFSNKYTEKTISNSQYNILIYNLDKINVNNYNLFNLNKYKNVQNKSSYLNFVNIELEKDSIYDTYNAKNINWQLLYEEEKFFANQRTIETTFSLIVKITYDYIQNFINMMI